MNNGHKVALENALNLSELCSTGSILHINADYEELEYHGDIENVQALRNDYIGEPVRSIEEFEKQLKAVDEHGFVKKKILEEGGGLPLDKGCTVSVSFAGYWENELEPFDWTKLNKPLVAKLNENGLLPGIQIAIESMLVGEMAAFLLSYEVMYGEMGVPPRIKPKADCIFYIKIIKSIITPKDGDINFAEPHMFERVQKEVKLLYSSGVTLHKTKAFPAAILSFKRGINMLHKCRLADEKEEALQEKLLIKLYINLAICYNATKQPLKTCIACNELNRLRSLWNNAKALFQNAKALRMIGQFDEAQKKLKRALQLSPQNENIVSEIKLNTTLKDSCNQSRLIENRILNSMPNVINENFKTEVDNLIKIFKDNNNLCKLTLPVNLNAAEIDYIKEACVRENLFCNKLEKEYLLDKDGEKSMESEVELLSLM